MIKGVIELLTPTYLSGWAVDDAAPDPPLTVQAILDQQEIAHSINGDLRRRSRRRERYGTNAMETVVARGLPADSARCRCS